MSATPTHNTTRSPVARRLMLDSNECDTPMEDKMSRTPVWIFCARSKPSSGTRRLIVVSSSPGAALHMAAAVAGGPRGVGLTFRASLWLRSDPWMAEVVPAMSPIMEAALSSEARSRSIAPKAPRLAPVAAPVCGCRISTGQPHEPSLVRLGLRSFPRARAATSRQRRSPGSTHSCPLEQRFSLVSAPPGGVADCHYPADGFSLPLLLLAELLKPAAMVRRHSEQEQALPATRQQPGPSGR